MPANTTALVMSAPPGGGLLCRAHEEDFDLSGIPVRRGVVSYYATSTMVQAADFESWADWIERRSSADLADHKITLLKKPMLQVCGDPSTQVLGEQRG